MSDAVWTGSWVERALGVRLIGDVRDLAGLAVRRNPRRAHLVVSAVLGKHVPVDPRVVRAAAEDLGRAVVAVLDAEDRASVVVLGFAETATALGQSVSDVLDAPYLHSTRADPAGRAPALGFEEEHSHASAHRVLPVDPTVLDHRAVVLVDDELTTGTTAANTIRALHARSPHPAYVVASLLDLRQEPGASVLAELAEELGTRIVVVALGTGHVEVSADVLERGTTLVASLPDLVGPAAETAGSGRSRRIAAALPEGLRFRARYGLTRADRAGLDAALGPWADAVAAEIGRPRPGARVHVLGTEELMYLPIRLGGLLADAWEGVEVTFSSTTRSPAVVVDDPGYAIRSGLKFTAYDGDDAPRFAYNLDQGFDLLAVVLETEAEAAAAAGPGGLLERLAMIAPDVAVVVLDAGTAA